MHFSFFLDKKRNKKVKGCDQILRFCLKRLAGIHQTRSFVAQTVVASYPPALSQNRDLLKAHWGSDQSIRENLDFLHQIGAAPVCLDEGFVTVSWNELSATGNFMRHPCFPFEKSTYICSDQTILT
jgi:hypothetical protein